MATCTYNNIDCTNNFKCTMDTAGGSVTPADGQNNWHPSATYANPVTVNEQLYATDITTTHNNIVGELQRKRQSTVYATIDTSGNIGFSKTIERIKSNLAKLNIAISVTQNEQITNTLINNIYSQINSSGAQCACVTRCICNSRGCSGFNDCVTLNGTWGACSCNGRCTCNVRDSHLSSCPSDTGDLSTGGCYCNLRCVCDSRQA